MAYLVPGKSDLVELHKQACWLSYTSKPIAVRAPLALYRLFLWYLLHAWRYCFKTWLNNRKKEVEQSNISDFKQLGQLFKLAYFYTIPPRHYYNLKLYSFPSKEWLSFVYTHELPYWHDFFSPKSSALSRRLMSDKSFFERQMQSYGVPIVPSLFTTRKGETLLKSDLFIGMSLFLKPESGSRSQGCYELHYDKERACYTLNSLEGAEYTGEDEILLFVNLLTEQANYLYQPVLCNSSQVSGVLNKLGFSSKLATLRIITGVIDKSAISVISAIVEVKARSVNNILKTFAIDTYTGVVTFDENNVIKIEGWNMVVDAVTKAHTSCMDITTIGWDVAVTDTGPILLEGNYNWGVMVHQKHGAPIVQYFLERYLASNQR